MFTNREEMAFETDIISLGLSDDKLTYIIRKCKKKKKEVNSTFIKAKPTEDLMRLYLTVI